MHFSRWLGSDKAGVVFGWAPPHDNDAPTSVAGLAEAEQRAVELARDAGPHIIFEMCRLGLLKPGEDPVAAVREMVRP